MSSSSRERESFLPLRRVFEKLFGNDQLRSWKASISDEAIAMEQKFEDERKINDFKASFLRSASETLKTHYTQQAKTEIAVLDNESWKKGLIMKAKDTLDDKANQLEYSRQSARWNYINKSNEINKKSFRLEEFVSSWNAIGSKMWTGDETSQAKCDSTSKQYLSAAERFSSLENCHKNASDPDHILFQSVDLQNFVRRAFSNGSTTTSPVSANGFWLDKIHGTFSDGMETIRQRIGKCNESLRSSWNSLTDNTPRGEAFQQDQVISEINNQSLESIFPNNQWSTEEFLEYRKNKVLHDQLAESSEERSILHEGLAMHELILLLRARVDMERIGMCEFLFQEQASADGIE